MGKIKRSAKVGGKLGCRLNRLGAGPGFAGSGFAGTWFRWTVFDGSFSLDPDLEWRGHPAELGDRVQPSSDLSKLTGMCPSGMVTITTSPDRAASFAVTAFAPVSLSRSASVSGPREFATTTSCSSARRRRARVRPMFPALMMAIFTASYWFRGRSCAAARFESFENER